MKTPIPIRDKKKFIAWFLKNFQFKKRESVWILNYLLNHDSILENIHFVREARFCPRSMVISTVCSEKIPFRFYKRHIVTTNAEKSFHDLRMNRDEPLFIELHFKHANDDLMYASVLEENPYLPDDYYLSEEDKEVASQLLNQTLYLYQKEQIKHQIDVALDTGNKLEFLRLSKELKELEHKKNQPPLG